MSRTQKSKRPRKTCRTPRRIPYGLGQYDPYCHAHDTCFVMLPNPKGARQKAKKEIKEEEE